MPQIKLPLIAIVMAAGFALSGCGDKNSQVNFDADKGAHLDAKWVTSHPAYVNAAPANVATALDSCTMCHGSGFDGGIAQVSCMSATAVSAFRCHATSPAVNPTGCISCHGNQPSGPFANTAPNRQFAHAAHTALLSDVGVVGIEICNTCHAGAGSGTANHAKAKEDGTINRATVAFSDKFSAKKPNDPTVLSHPTIVRDDSVTCLSVRCHGGQSTPAWNTSISLTAGDNSLCTQCHEPGTAPGLPQKNSYFSGSVVLNGVTLNLHSSHLLRRAFCTDCHNITKLTDRLTHYGDINTINPVTNTYYQDLSNTIPGKTVGNGDPNGTGGYSPAQIKYFNPVTQTCSNVSCHNGDRQWR